MSREKQNDPTPDQIHEAASRWVVLRDRGLSAKEAIEFELWLAESTQHAAAYHQANANWRILDRIPPELARTVLEKVTQRRRFQRNLSIGCTLLAAAAALAIAFIPRQSSLPSETTDHSEEATFETALDAAEQITQTKTLPDGTIVQLNSGSEIVELYTPSERRVVLISGEAHFDVAKNPSRPFIVRAGNVDVRAVGTAFNVNLQSAAVEVLVTEGTVKLSQNSEKPGVEAPKDLVQKLVSGQRAVVALAPESDDTDVVVATVTADEIAEALSWQGPLIRLGGATLAELAADFRRRTGQHVTLHDESLAKTRVGGYFRADDIEGFVRLLQQNYGIIATRKDRSSIELRWASSNGK